MAEKIYYALVNFYARQEGWLTMKAQSPEEAKEILKKEFGENEAMKDFNILDVRDTPPIDDVVTEEQEEETKEETVH